MSDDIKMSQTYLQAVLEQIVNSANHSNDPTEFTFQTAEILYDAKLISKSVFWVLTGQL